MNANSPSKEKDLKISNLNFNFKQLKIINPYFDNFNLIILRFHLLNVPYSQSSLDKIPSFLYLILNYYLLK